VWLSLRTIDALEVHSLSFKLSSQKIDRHYSLGTGERVQPQAETAPPPRVKKKRRGIRLNSRVPVVIEWQKTEPAGACREEAFTRVVGPYGCLVVLKERLELEQSLRIVNLATNESNSAVIVWKGNERPDGWELGIELIHPAMDFWGLEL
jgi:hypothetical protein